MTDIIQQEIEKCISFPDYLKLSKAVSNPVGFLTLSFARLHPHAPNSDMESLGGRMAKLWVMAHKDTGYLLKLIWDTSSANIAGSHLNYIQGILGKNGVTRVLPKRLEGHAGMRTD
jgi:hypothetical protein